MAGTGGITDDYRRGCNYVRETLCGLLRNHGTNAGQCREKERKLPEDEDTAVSRRSENGY